MCNECNECKLQRSIQEYVYCTRNLTGNMLNKFHFNVKYDTVIRNLQQNARSQLDNRSIQFKYELQKSISSKLKPCSTLIQKTCCFNPVPRRILYLVQFINGRQISRMRFTRIQIPLLRKQFKTFKFRCGKNATCSPTLVMF